MSEAARTQRPRFFRHPARYVVVAFVGAASVGTLLLLLPWATEPGQSTGVLAALFTATSAVCVTGLTVVDTGTHWSAFGEGVILLLIQAGGLGIMTMSALLLVGLSRRLGLRQRLVVAASTGSLELGEVRSILRGVTRVTLVAESAVAVVLLLRLWTTHGVSFQRSAYLGVFHSISSFNNAGFSVHRDNLVGYQDDPVVLLVIAAAVVVGGLGFPVWVQIARRPWTPRAWDLHAKITVAATGVLIVAGWLLLTAFEWRNAATLGSLDAADSIVNGLFHSITPRTAGFNSLDISAMHDESLLVTEVLMFIGGGSGSTAGGIKVTTFAVLGFVMWAEVRGDPDVVVFRRRVPTPAQRQALTVALLAIGVVVVADLALLLTTDLSQRGILFEVISALAVVGLSTGITPLLSDAAQLCVIGLMFLGRIGPPTLFAALVLREHDRLYRHPQERPIIG